MNRLHQKKVLIENNYDLTIVFYLNLWKHRQFTSNKMKLRVNLMQENKSIICSKILLIRSRIKRYKINVKPTQILKKSLLSLLVPPLHLKNNFFLPFLKISLLFVDKCFISKTNSQIKGCWNCWMSSAYLPFYVKYQSNSTYILTFAWLLGFKRNSDNILMNLNYEITQKNCKTMLYYGGRNRSENQERYK